MRRPFQAHKKGSSVADRLVGFLLLMLLVQIGIYLLLFLRGGIIQETEENAYSIFQEQTANRKLYLENEMQRRWSNTREGELDVARAVTLALEERQGQIADLRQDSDMCQQIVASAAPDLIAMLRRNSVTGVFLVLNSPDGEGAYPGIYIRDYDPAGYPSGNKDLLMERGLPALARENNIPMDSYWSAFFHMPDPAAVEHQFFFAPVAAAEREEPGSRNSAYFYRWSERFCLSDMDREVITYSVPLVWEDGTVYGVMGVDLTVDYLASQLQYDELGDERSGAYFLGVSRDGGATYSMVCTSGPNYKVYFGQGDTLNTRPGPYGDIAVLSSATGEGGEMYGAVQPLKLYNSNTPFEEEQWALIGILDGDHLMRFSTKISTLLILSAVIFLLVGAVMVIAVARSLTRPIIKLAGALRQSDPDQPIVLPRTRISEIDALAEAVETLSHEAVEFAARSTKIINMTSIPIGTYEYGKEDERVFCGGSLFQIMGWPEQVSGDVYLERGEFERRMKQFEGNLYEEEEELYRLPQTGGADRWVQSFHRQEGDTVLGAVQDVTRDIESKRKIEYERDFDVLTDLYNRRGFDQRMRSLFTPERRGVLGVAALLMFDLDNLKFVNDSYGHDYGDRYIQAFGRSLGYFYCCRSLMGRRSGDEFNVFLYGYGSKEEIRALIQEFWAQAQENAIPLPNGEAIRVRASGGLAWYPDNAETCEDLMRKADFAMYNIKHTVKGNLREFSDDDYKEKSILVQGQDALNRLLDGKLVRFALQPVIAVEDGGVYGYELLMRPQVEQLKDLGQLFRLAKSQSKFLQMEQLTWYEGLATFARLDEEGTLPPDTHIFINSIGSQVLPSEDLDQLEGWYRGLLHRVVVEITEDEEASSTATRKKQERAAQWEAQLALDDFGTGFNSEAMLVNVAPQLVKVDISIIHNIDKDPDRLELLKNLIRYARTRGIRVLAEGVETYEEMDTVVACGVDYLQGYYLGRPEFDPAVLTQQVADELRHLRERYCKL